MSVVFHRSSFILRLLLLAFLSACSHPLPALITLNEQLKQDQSLGIEMTSQLDREVRFKNDPVVQKFLLEVGEKLVKRIDVLKSMPFQVQMIDEQKHQWRNFGLPGTKIYLSVGLLKQVEFENEIAAAIAFELAHITNRHAVERLTNLSNTRPGPIVDYTGPRGVMAFPEKLLLKSIENAVEILYAAGYDPRGLLSVWERYLVQPRQSHYDRSTLNHLIEATRSTLALYAPLRNPIVKSPSFFSVYKRLKRL